MKDAIQVTRYMNEFGYIMVIKLKLLQLKEMLDIRQVSCNQVIHSDDMVSLSLTKRSQRCDPRNPAAPVIKTLLRSIVVIL